MSKPSKRDSEIVGHKTFHDAGGYRHEPLTRAEADVLMKRVDKAKRERAKLMPDEKAAVRALFEAQLRLKELGWNDGIYCPKDGSKFKAIQIGSTGIFDCICEGEWPHCTWTIFDEHDAYPSSQAPALIFKPEKSGRARRVISMTCSQQGHNCETQLVQAGKAYSGYCRNGETWWCPCGKLWIHLCDEAEGCQWAEMTTELGKRADV